MMESVLLLLGVIFLVLIFVGIPVGYAMILTAAAHFYVLSPGLSPTVIAQRPVGLISESFTLLAVPLFLLAGNLLNACGMTARLVAFSVALVGHVRGGLGHAVVVANVIMAGMSGSATADAAGIGSIMIPSLIRAGFSPRAAAALTASAATLGPDHPAERRHGPLREPLERVARAAPPRRLPPRARDGALPDGRTCGCRRRAPGWRGRDSSGGASWRRPATRCSPSSCPRSSSAACSAACTRRPRARRWPSPTPS